MGTGRSSGDAKPKAMAMHDWFDERGFLGGTVTAAVPDLRAENADWFALAEDINAAMNPSRRSLSWRKPKSPRGLRISWACRIAASWPQKRNFSAFIAGTMRVAWVVFSTMTNTSTNRGNSGSMEAKPWSPLSSTKTMWSLKALVSAM